MASENPINAAAINFSRLQLAKALKEDPEDENALPVEQSAIFTRSRMQHNLADIPLPNQFHVPRPISLVLPQPLATANSQKKIAPSPKTPPPNTWHQNPTRYQHVNTNSSRNSVVMLGDIEPNEAKNQVSDKTVVTGAIGSTVRHTTLMDVRNSMIQNRPAPLPFSAASSHRTSQLLHQRSLSDVPKDSQNKQPHRVSRLNNTLTVTTDHLQMPRASSRPPSVEFESSPTRNSPSRPQSRPPSTYTGGNQSPVRVQSRPSSAYSGSTRPPSIVKYTPPVDSETDEEDDDDESEGSNSSSDEEIEVGKKKGRAVKLHHTNKPSKVARDSSSESEKNADGRQTSPPRLQLTKVDEQSEESSEESEEDEEEEEEESSDDETPLALKPRLQSTPKIKVETPPRSPLVEAWISDVSKQQMSAEPVFRPKGHRSRPPSHVGHSPRRNSHMPDQMSEARQRRPRSTLVPEEYLASADYYTTAAPSRRRSNSEFARPKSYLIPAQMPGPIQTSARQDWAKDTMFAVNESYRSNAVRSTPTQVKAPGEFYMTHRVRSGSTSSQKKGVHKQTYHRESTGSGGEYQRDNGEYLHGGHYRNGSSDLRKEHRRESSGSSGGSHRSFPASPKPQFMYHQGNRSRESLHSTGSSHYRTSSENVMSHRGSTYIQPKNRVR